jgi:hypothetical protein
MLCDDVLLIVFSYLDILRDIPRLVKLLEQVSLLSQITPTELTLCSTSIERDISTIELLYPHGCLNNVTCLYASNCKQSELIPTTTPSPPIVRLAKCLPNLRELYLRNFKTDISMYDKKERYQWLMNIKTIFNNLQVIDLSYLECNYYRRFLPGDVEIINIKNSYTMIELIEYLEDISTRYKIVTRDPFLLRNAINSNELSLLKYCKYPSILDISSKNLKCNLDTLYSVLKRVPINEKHPITGTTIIQRIIERFTQNIIPLLTIKEYLPIILTKDYVGKTVLHYFVRNDYTYYIYSPNNIKSILDLLLNNYSISTQADDTGCTPLDDMLLFLVQKPSLKLVNAGIMAQIFIDYGCPMTSKTIDYLSRFINVYRDIKLVTPLIINELYNKKYENNLLMTFQKLPFVETIECLRDITQIPMLTVINQIKDENNRNVLHIMIEHNYNNKKSTSKQLIIQIEQCPKVRQLVNEKDSYGQTPFHLATRNYNYYVLQALVNAGADVNIDIQEGVSLLHDTIFCNHNIQLARFLLGYHRLLLLNSEKDCIWKLIDRKCSMNLENNERKQYLQLIPYMINSRKDSLPPVPDNLKYVTEVVRKTKRK